MAFEYREFPEFSWSQSRRSTFRQCPRQYYWQYYGAHNGWYEDADETARQAYRLKKITSFPEFLGSVIHDLAADTIRNVRGGGSPYTADELLQIGRDKLNRAYAQSKRRKDWSRRPNQLTMFHDFYYGKGPSRDVIDRTRDRLLACVTNLLEALSYREALEAPFVEVKEVDQGPQFFLLDEYTIYAQPDLLYRTGDGTYHVVDWKTGQEDAETHALQLRTYALYVRSRDDLEMSGIEGRIEYLFKGTSTSFPIGDAEIDEERRGIVDSIAMMQKYLVDPEANEARARESFPLREDTSDCRYCRFFEMCEVEIAGATTGPF